MRWRRKPTVWILGCGPAGLFAAEAASQKGYPFVILSKKRQSEMFGAQYLHAPIPSLTETGPRTIRYGLMGTVEQYRTKVYGEDYTGPVSAESLLGDHPGWDIREAYDNAWARWGGYVEETLITKEWLASGTLDQRDPVIWSIPLAPFCVSGHTFASTKVWAVGDAPERGQRCPVEVPEWSVVCNGETSPGWYRAANVFGYRTAEWPERNRPPIAGVAEVTKPTFTNCDCWMQGNNVLRVGRYGTWTKGEFSHHAYEKTMAWLR